MTVETIQIAPVAIGGIILLASFVAVVITSLSYQHRVNVLERVIQVKSRQIQRLKNQWSIR